MSGDYQLGKNLTPASPAEMDRLRSVEKARKKWDKFYISADQAKGIPQELADKDPSLQARIQASAPDWPERKLAASEALGDLAGGQGERIEKRGIPSEELFTGRPVGEGSE